MRGHPKVYNDLDELKAKESVKLWLTKLASGDSQVSALYSFARYLRWRKARGLESDPDKMINECLDGNNRTLIKHLNEALEYANAYEGRRETALKQYKRIRSFYAHNHIELSHETLSIKVGSNWLSTRVTAKDYIEYVAQVLTKAKLGIRDRAIILIMFQSGMDASTLALSFNYYGYLQLADALGSDPNQWEVSTCRVCPIKIKVVRPKREIEYYTFIDIDAVNAIRDYLTLKRGTPAMLPVKPGEMPKSEPLFLNQFGQSITPKAIPGS